MPNLYNDFKAKYGFVPYNSRIAFLDEVTDMDFQETLDLEYDGGISVEVDLKTGIAYTINSDEPMLEDSELSPWEDDT